MISLCSYAAFTAGSAQYAWLQRDLGAIDRSKTPWLIVIMHTPWYTSNAHHPMSEGAEMRAAMEPLLLAAGADLILCGCARRAVREMWRGRRGEGGVEREAW